VKTPRFVRTTSFRLIALYAGLFAASTAALFGIVYWVTGDVLYEQLRLSLQNEMTSFEAGSAKKGSLDLAAAIREKIASPNGQPFYYSLQDPSGRRIAGNLAELDAVEGWHGLPQSDERSVITGPSRHEDGDHDLLALGRRLPDGSFLTIAADTHRVTEAEEAIARSFAWGAGATLLLALVGGIVLSRGFLRRVDEINRTTRAIMRGDLTDRIKAGGTGDELDQLARNLNEMLDRLQHLMDGLRQVSNDIAHDLRTPLSRLKQGLEAARLEATSLSDYKQAVDQALQDADLALSTFGALLRIAQIEAGTRRANFTDLDLSSLMVNLALTYSAVAEDMNKTLVSSVEPGLYVRGDRELLAQLFVNLIENALRHTPAGATVGMSLSRGEHRPIAEIFDDGPGIPETEYGNVFRRFYRLETSRTTSGSGLGLALVATVADLHGASIVLTDNDPGLKVSLQFKEHLDGPISREA
jgi:signal transduction histidine kinase